MPETSPLKAMSHWRRGIAAMFMARVLKSQLLRKRNRISAAGKGHGRPLGGESPDAGNGRSPG